jgi:AraC family transcriptional regulator
LERNLPLHNYSSRKHILRDYADGLPKYKLRRAIEYINEHLAENITLNAIASELGMSQYYFASLFKRSLGITVYQYVIQCRIERAKQLLKQKKIAIADIGTQVGFVDQSHFTRYFKRIVGVTPKGFLEK